MADAQAKYQVIKKTQEILSREIANREDALKEYNAIINKANAEKVETFKKIDNTKAEKMEAEKELKAVLNS